VTLKTLTPNFKRYEARIDGSEWGTSAGEFEWDVHSGRNRLEARTVNAFGVMGPSPQRKST
jgi:hypothetical protein